MTSELTALSEPMPTGGGRIEGSTPLAGHLGLPSLLIREAVQNAWDARDDYRGAVPVSFDVHGWDLTGSELDDLRSLLPVEELRGFDRRTDDDSSRGLLHPATVLERDLVRTLVISDRNTVGLCGPTLSGSHWEPVRYGSKLERGQQRFANFIRNIGRASADIGEGDGGAYGVGKSALWLASECGTIIVHTRTTDENGESTERLIGTIHGEHFYDKGREFTGRHFIGVEEAGQIQPLEGPAANEGASRLPLPSYDFGNGLVDGTSIVIVAPRLHLGWDIELDRLRDAIRWHVWPKRVPGARGGDSPPDLDVTLGANGAAHRLPAPLDDPEIRPYARALLHCVERKTEPVESGSRDVEARCHRPKKDLGRATFRNAGLPDDNTFHLTLTEGATSRRGGLAAEGLDVEPAVDFAAPWGQIALIRRDPLLLVRYEPIGGPDTAATEVGVFLSAADREVEEALTKAEPPAHDDWIDKIVPKDHPKDHRRTYAKRTIAEIKRAKAELLAAFRNVGTSHVASGEQLISKQISEGLTGGFGGKPMKKTTRPSSGGGTKTQRAELSLKNTDDTSLTETIYELAVTVSNLDPQQGMRLEASSQGRDNTGSLDVDNHVAYRWTARNDALDIPGSAVEIEGAPPGGLTLWVRVEGDLRVRPKVKVSRYRWHSNSVRPGHGRTAKRSTAWSSRHGKPRTA